MNKTLLIARHEYMFNLRRPAFLFAVFGVPIFTFVMWFLIFAVISGNEENIEQIGTVGYVDQAGVLTDVTLPENMDPELFVVYDSEVDARQALDDRTIGAYFVLPVDYLASGQVNLYSYTGIPDALKSEINTLLRANLSRRVESNVSLDRIQDPVNMTVHIADTGRTLTQANIPALVFLPMIFAFVFIMASGVTSGFLMNSVVEEKTNRVMEILVTTVTPMQLLLGKILGLGALGLTQVLVWGIAVAVLITVGQAVPFLAGISVPVDLMIVFLLYFILSYFLLASLMGGLGAVAGSEQESRQYSSFLSILWVIPFFFFTTFLDDPNGPVAIALTMIPFTSPMTMLLRMGFAAVPTWQIIASLIILLITTVLVTWAAAKVFRWGLLMYGKRLSLRELFRVVRQRPQSGTVVAHERQEAAS